MKQTPRAYLFMGQSGAGKGTISQMILSKVERKTLYIATGDLFKNWMQEPTYTIERIREKNAKGELIEDAWAVMLACDFLNKHFTGNEDIFFDGFPRSRAQAQMLHDVLAGYGLEVIILHVQATDEECYRRIEERHKTNPRPETATSESITKKLSWYWTDVIPALEYLRSKGVSVLDIDGMVPILEAVNSTVEKAAISLKPA